MKAATDDTEGTQMGQKQKRQLMRVRMQARQNADRIKRLEDYIGKVRKSLITMEQACIRLGHADVQVAIDESTAPDVGIRVVVSSVALTCAGRDICMAIGADVASKLIKFQRQN